MAETRRTNVVIPEVFSGYTFEPWYERSRLFKSGIVMPNTSLNSNLDGGGDTFNFPFWQPLSGDSEIPSETVAQTVNAITADKQIAARQQRTKAWGANAVSAIAAGGEPLDRFGNDVREYWTQEYDKNAFATIQGVYADNVANDSGDLVEDGSAASFVDDGVTAARMKLGENGVAGRSDSDDFVAIAVHPDIYQTMQDNDLIDTVPISNQERVVNLYRGMAVIVDKNAPILSTTPNVYLTTVFKTGALQFGQSSAMYEPTSIERIENKGMGITEVYTRRVFAMHPGGFAWQNSSVAGLSPTYAELRLAANWDRVYNKENIRMVFYTSLA